MTTPDDLSEPSTGSEPSTASGANVSAPRASDAAVSSGGARTPPPRTRRGSPTSRPPATADETSAPTPAPTPESAPASRKGATRAVPPPQPVASSTKVFDWDDAPAAPGAVAVTATAAATGVVTPDVGLEEPVPAFERGPEKTRTPKAKRAKRPERRFRQTIVRVDLWSVTKMALCFYVSMMAIMVVALIALWTVAESAGVIGNVEKFVGDLFSSKDFHFLSAQVLRGAVLVAVVLVALLVVFTIVAASFYNIFAELFGGVEVVIREEEQPPKR